MAFYPQPKPQPRAVTKHRRRVEADAALTTERVCVQCGRAFKAWSPAKTTKCCSRACAFRRKREQNPNRTKGCAVCGQTIDVAKPVPNQKTCGARACLAEFVRRKTRRQVACRRCKAMFWPVRQPTGVFEKWCSRACYDAERAERRWVVMPCGACGRTIRKDGAQAKRRASVFCSRTCQATYFQGDRHPLFRGNADPNRGRGWKRLAESIRQRDAYTCQRCGKTQEEEGRRLSVDHLIPWRRFDDKDAANDPSNLFALCHTCHGYKTAYVERRWLMGDVLAFERFRESLLRPSAVIGVSA